MRFRSLTRVAAPLLALSLVAYGCGDDDDGDDEDAAATTTTEGAAGENAELCALAEDLFEQEDFPSAAQIEQYVELAPPELEEATSIAGPPVIAADGETVAFFNAIAEDDVEEAVAEIDEWERENCGIDHEPPYPAEVNEIDPDATRVDVAAAGSDGNYTFDFDEPIPAGRVSFVLTNPTDEAHFMFLTRILEGHTLQEALEFEGDPQEAGITEDGKYDSGLAAPGGEDEEVLTDDLVPGSWAMLCFVSSADGTPHALNGMATPFTVE